MKAATISECGKYRYTLSRMLRSSGPLYAFFGINPSTADAIVPDATVRKWTGFVTAWGGRGYIVGNAFAYRATKVRELAGVEDPVGEWNNFHLNELIRQADILVPCYGRTSKVPKDLRGEFERLRVRLRESGKPVKIFGLTKCGHPMHPLMLAYSTQLQDWAA